MTARARPSRRVRHSRSSDRNNEGGSAVANVTVNHPILWGAQTRFSLRTCEFPDPNRGCAPRRDPVSDRAEIVGSLAGVEAVAVDEARFVGTEASRSAGCRSSCLGVVGCVSPVRTASSCATRRMWGACPHCAPARRSPCERVGAGSDPPPERAACAPSLRGVADRRACKCRSLASGSAHGAPPTTETSPGRSSTASITSVGRARRRSRRFAADVGATLNVRHEGVRCQNRFPLPIGTSRVSDPSFGTPSAPVHEKLALQVELCSPGSLVSRAHGASGECGLSAGVLATGPVDPP